MRRPLIFALALSACSEYSLQGDERPEDLPLEDTAATTAPSPEPDIVVEPSSLDFGLLPPECTSDRQTLTVHNVGDADLDVREILLGDDDEGAYRLLGAPAVVAPGGSLQVEVDFTPPDHGEFDVASVRVVSDDPDEPEVDVPLSGMGADEAVIVEQFTQNPAMPVDVLWVIDNSGSMGDEVDHLTSTFQSFLNGFVALGLDYQLGVVSTDMNDPDQSGRLQGATPIITSSHPDPLGAFVTAATLGTSGSAEERPLDAALAALTSPLIDGHNLGFVRPDSHLSIIVVTDENDSSAVGANAFAAWLDSYHGDPARSSLSAMAGPKGGLFPCTAILAGISAAPAPKLWNVIQQTGGIHVSICDMDMSSMLTQLSVTSAGMLTRFTLAHAVTDPQQVYVKIDGVNVPWGAVNGFTFDEATNTVELHGAAVPPPGSTVSVRYEAAAACPS